MKKTFGEYKLTKINDPCSQATSYIVFDRGLNIIGFVSKYKNTSTETHPWKAFGVAYAAGRNNPQFSRDQFATFYEDEGGLEAAVAQVVKFYNEKVN